MDLTLKAQSEEAYTRMGKAYLELAGEYIQYLKRCGTYENSWIVILADHGHHLSPNVAERFHPFMLIKRPGETHEKMQEDGSILLMRDIAPTILEELGLPIPENVRFGIERPKMKKSARSTGSTSSRIIRQKKGPDPFPTETKR